jgi:hypothetical protein
MNDPWRFLAFPTASVVGYLVSLGAATPVSASIGLTPFAAEMLVIAVTGLIAGFMVDEVIPTYLEHVGEGRGGGGGGSDGFDDDDLDFE